MSIPGRFRRLTLDQQLINLRMNPLTRGVGGIKHGVLTWRFQASPSPISRTYDLRLTYPRNGVPATFVEQPDLTVLANVARIPHLYSEHPTRLCLYHPDAYEWRPNMLLVRTVVPWAILWLWYFEDWLASGEWRGGGVHISSEIEAEIIDSAPSPDEIAKPREEAA